MHRKKNILLIASEYPPGPGGIGHHAFSLVKSLYGSGYSVTVMSPADYASPNEVSNFDAVQPYNIARFRQSGKITTYVHRIFLVINYLRKEQGDTSVILTGRFPLWLGLIIKLLFSSKRTIAVLHGTEVNLPNYILRLLTHQSIAVADVIVPVSEFTKSLLPARILDKHRNIVIIKNGIDEVWSSQRPGIKIDLAGYPRLLTVGHVSPRKGQHRVIKALPRLVSRFPQIHYHIVGLPLNQNNLERLAEELGVRQHITFHGRVSQHTDLRDYYVSADIFMLLSENQPDGDVEGFGIVALEANLHGLPVVGARYCGVEEAVSHKNSGYLVDGNEAEEILEGVTYCLNHKDELGPNSIDWAKRHQWDEIVKQYLEVLY